MDIIDQLIQFNVGTRSQIDMVMDLVNDRNDINEITDYFQHVNENQVNMPKILSIFGVNEDKYHLVMSAPSKYQSNPKVILKRIKVILEIYSKWIDQQKNKENSKENVNIYDIINMMHPSYDFTAFLRDYHDITTNKEILILLQENEDFEDEKEEEDICSASECLTMVSK